MRDTSTHLHSRLQRGTTAYSPQGLPASSREAEVLARMNLNGRGN